MTDVVVVQNTQQVVIHPTGKRIVIAVESLRVISAGTQGPQGPQGIQGIQGKTGAAGADGMDGADGADGADGTDGSIWYNDSGAPDNGVGIDGDYYLDNDTGNYYWKQSGSWVLRGDLSSSLPVQGASFDYTAGLLTLVTFDDSSTISFTYTEDDQLETVTDGSVTKTFSYDGNGVLQSVAVS